LSKSFAGGSRGVESLSLRVEAGEYLVLLGPSGCGKTTTLRLIAGLETPDGGRVVMGGVDQTGAPPHRRGVALVFQDSALYPHLAVRDNLAFGLRLQGVPRAEVAARVEETARLLGLSHLLSRRPGTLSGGERRRVALGRALARRPRYLLLDEPLSGLDTPARLDLRGTLSRLHRQHPTTTLHVTHDQEEALALGERLAVMSDGKLLQSGTPREVYACPQHSVVATFLGSPPMNLLRRTRHGVPCLLGVRPQDVHLTETPEMTATVESVEYRGSESIVRLNGEEAITVVVRNRDLRPGERVGIRLDPATLHWFDSVSGTRLPDSPPSSP
jgi:ABC-type sugar transport system ATPase subunit